MKPIQREWISKKIIFCMFGIALAAVMFSGIIAISAHAQSEVDWSDPINLSRSGSATDSVMVRDSDGVYHVIWLDEFEGLVHTSGDGMEWSVPTGMTLPTTDTVPDLIADTRGNIHAFWKDLDGRLFYSRARASLLPSSNAWSSRALLNNDVLDFDVALDDLGDLHLSYINPLDTEAVPAGVYYRYLRSGTSTWLSPTLLYASPYFRSLEQADTNVDVATSVVGEEKRIFVAWDNRPRERIYLAVSDDDGRTWTEPLEIDQPQTGLVGSGPSNILVEASGEQVLLLWRVGEPESFCNQYYQSSQDRGETWSLRQPIYGSTPICLNEVQIVPGEQYTIVMGKADQAYLLAWDGNRWSDPQLEEPLTAFIDPDTQNPVELGCLQMVQDNASDLMQVTGCDQGIGQDIWSLRRQLFNVSEWFPRESGWGALEDVDSDQVKLLSPVIIKDQENRDHIFWSKSDSIAPESLGKSIYYSASNAGDWSPSAEIYVSSSGKAEQIDAAIDSDNRLFIVWSGGSSGEIYFSQADSSQAFIPDSWSDPVALPSPLPVGSSPDIYIDDNDVIYVSYTVPLNEERGVYFTKSLDSGLSWSEPSAVFDAQEAGWAMVDASHLSKTMNGDLHIIWSRYSIPSGEGPLALYYANSSDGGATWSDPEIVVDDPVIWSDIVGTGEVTIERVWQQKSSSGSTLWHEQSLDGGETWTRISPVSVFGEIVGNPSLSYDSAGNLHLLLVLRSGVDTYALQHWIYDGSSWRVETRYDLQFSLDTVIHSLSSDFSDQGNLGVVLLNSDYSAEGDQLYQLIYTNQEVEVPDITPPPTAQPTATRAPAATSIPTAVATKAAPTSEAALATPEEFPDGSEDSGGLSWIGIIAPVAIGVIVLIVAVLIVRWIRS